MAFDHRNRRGRRLTGLALLLGAGLLGAALIPDFLLQNLSFADGAVEAALEYATETQTELPEPGEAPVSITLQTSQVLRTVDERYVSFALDSSQVVGGRWWSKEGKVEVGRGSQRTPPFDFDRSELVQRALALSPGYLRVGGTEADHIYYAVGDPSSARTPGYELSLTRERWRALNKFAASTQLDLMFTVNAGPGPRNEAGSWTTNNAESLMLLTAAEGWPVPVWELGNEPNAYWFIHGLGTQPSGEQYAQDFGLFRRLVLKYFPEARVAGPAAFYWPLVGEPMSGSLGVLEDFLKTAEVGTDIVTWHYYPQQSRRCPMATRRANLTRLLNPTNLDELTKWGRQVQARTKEHAPKAEVWLGETGNAQCGGEPGVSDRYVASLWWLDQLGLAAVIGQRVVIRQTLVGSDYGLLRSDSLNPTPDYYATLIWKKLMGTRVLRVASNPANPYLRSYAHCTSESSSPGSVTLLLLNLHQTLESEFVLPELSLDGAQVYTWSGESLTSKRALLNGVPLTEIREAKDQLVPERLDTAKPLTVPPVTAKFFVLPGAAASACRARD